MRELNGKIRHFFHLAALYDLTADAQSQVTANVDGTRHALDFAEAIKAGVFHHVSSIAAAGLYAAGEGKIHAVGWPGRDNGSFLVGEFTAPELAAMRM